MMWRSEVADEDDNDGNNGDFCYYISDAFFIIKKAFVMYELNSYMILPTAFVICIHYVYVFIHVLSQHVKSDKIKWSEESIKTAWACLHEWVGTEMEFRHRESKGLSGNQRIIRLCIDDN